MMKKLKTVVVGLNMGRNHCKTFHASPCFDLVAICDINPERNDWVQKNVANVKAYLDYHAMILEEKPDVVVVATPTALHAEMTCFAAQNGVTGIYCEKPMAVSLKEAKQMMNVCKEKNVSLMVGHQRRCTPVYRKMKELMYSGAIGEPYLIRVTCAGDMLSDGTHSVDSAKFFMNDEDPAWILASVFRYKIGTPLYADVVFDGTRYGHNADSGMQTTLHFNNNMRVEIMTGGVWFPNRGYQDVEIFGSKGRLWRQGDSADPALLIQDEQAGGFRKVEVEQVNESGVTLDLGGHGADFIERLAIVNDFGKMIEEKGTHSMDGYHAIKTHEIVMAAYESARTRSQIKLPLQQEEYPLDLMLKDGDIV